MFGQHWHAGKTPFKWRFAGGSMMAHLQWHLSPHQPPPPPKKKKNKNKKKQKKHCQRWTLSDNTFWIRGCVGNESQYLPTVL